MSAGDKKSPHLFLCVHSARILESEENTGVSFTLCEGTRDESGPGFHFQRPRGSWEWVGVSQGSGCWDLIGSEISN